MMNHLRALAASLLILPLIATTATGAAAQAPTDLDPHVAFAAVDMFTSPSGEIWVDLTPNGAWEDGAPVDSFSTFFSVDISNDVSMSSSMWQRHAGEQLASGTFDGLDGPGDFTPDVLLIDGGQRVRISTNIQQPGPGESPLFFQVSAASMMADGGDRIEATPLSGQVPSDLPAHDPLLDATHGFDGSGFAEIVDPITSIDQIDPNAEATGDSLPPDSDTGNDAVTDASGEDPADDVSSGEPETASTDVTTSPTDGTAQGSSGGNGGSNAVTYGAVIALVAAFLAWILLRIRKNQDAKLAEIDAVGQEILDNSEPPSDD